MYVVSIDVQPFCNLLTEEELLIFIGKVAGECYNSSIEVDACKNRALNCITRGHHSPWEHYSITLKCTVDRGTSHALVRHRHCAFQQSSTIYQKYDELPIVVTDSDNLFNKEKSLYLDIQTMYNENLKKVLASRARDILPNALATNLIITTNVRQWMYMIQRRCGKGDSDKMHIWCKRTREFFETQYPKVLYHFDEWYKKHPL